MTTMMRRFSIPIVLSSLLVFLTSISIFPAEFAPPEDVPFTAKFDGTEQRYVQLLPADFNAANDNTLLIALHGHGSDRWQFVRDNRDECKGARDVALKYGAIYVSPDYRAKTSWMGPAAEADLVQIIELLKAKYRIRRVLLCGGSMGGSSSLTFTALHPDLIDGVASLNGTANHLEYEQFQDAISASFGGSKQKIPDEYKRRSAEYWPEKFTMPLAITTGGKDTLVPPESAIRLAKIVSKLQPNVLLIHRPEGGHSTNYDDTVAAVEYLFTRSEPR
ncbi:MAG: alpha/beta fold hydrolase [Planctomycetaceae bacterium]|nr:alpha/beta fold hydrolase [Planctomycetaceae bacterium]